MYVNVYLHHSCLKMSPNKVRFIIFSEFIQDYFHNSYILKCEVQFMTQYFWKNLKSAYKLKTTFDKFSDELVFAIKAYDAEFFNDLWENLTPTAQAVWSDDRAFVDEFDILLNKI